MPNPLTRMCLPCLAAAIGAAACADDPGVGEPLAPDFASTSTTIVFHTQLHPPDPCVDFSPEYDFGHVQLKFSDLVEGTWTSSWDGMLRIDDASLAGGGVLEDGGGEVLGRFSVLVSRAVPSAVRLEGTGSLGDGSVQAMTAAPEEYVVRLLDAGGATVLVGNLGVHPPDPC
ncbi:MAG TPA: hypothetical protein VK837_06750 [Longimicrobiales bacterium]|nr:hypothetical protein [Longimicrobiales bacterium]